MLTITWRFTIQLLSPSNFWNMKHLWISYSLLSIFFIAHLIDLHERFYFKKYCNLNIFFFFFTYVNSRQDQFNEELIIMNEFVNNSSNFICEYKSISGTTIVCIQSDLIANGIRNGTCAGNACTTFGSIPRFNLDLA